MSGIYIPGMEMPKSCDCCDFMTVEGEYGEPTCPFGLIIRCASEMHPDCPLVPVPEHGDLIERKAAYYSILNGMAMTGYQSRALDCINEFYAPTIIPASTADKEGEG